MIFPLDGPSQHTSISVNTTIVQELKGTSILTERKVVTVQPLSGSIYIYFGDGTGSPSAATFISDGLEQSKKTIHSYEAADSQSIYILAITGTVDVKCIERA